MVGKRIEKGKKSEKNKRTREKRKIGKKKINEGWLGSLKILNDGETMKINQRGVSSTERSGNSSPFHFRCYLLHDGVLLM